MNTQGKVAEGPGACLMLVRNGKLITPDVTSSILESITRDTLLTLAREDLGLLVEERPVESHRTLSCGRSLLVRHSRRDYPNCEH
nr:aminotransferase class IV [Thermorudis peleae]